MAGRRPAPRLLAPMARMLGTRQVGRVSLSATSLQTLLDGIGSRLDETRETSRYLIGVLVFLGLLGTFYGLLETVRVGRRGDRRTERRRQRSRPRLRRPQIGAGIAAGRDERPRSARRCSDLPAAWCSAFSTCRRVRRRTASTTTSKSGCRPTRGCRAAALGDGGDGSVPAYIQALLEQTADSLENLQRILARGEESRIGANSTRCRR